MPPTEWGGMGGIRLSPHAPPLSGGAWGDRPMFSGGAWVIFLSLWGPMGNPHGPPLYHSIVPMGPHIFPCFPMFPMPHGAWGAIFPMPPMPPHSNAPHSVGGHGATSLCPHAPPLSGGAWGEWGGPPTQWGGMGD